METDLLALQQLSAVHRVKDMDDSVKACRPTECVCTQLRLNVVHIVWDVTTRHDSS